MHGRVVYRSLLALIPIQGTSAAQGQSYVACQTVLIVISDKQLHATQYHASVRKQDITFASQIEITFDVYNQEKLGFHTCRRSLQTSS